MGRLGANSVAKRILRRSGVHSNAELFLVNVSAAIEDFCEATPELIENDAAAIALPQWRLVIAAAKPTPSAMKASTKMSEESDDRLER